MSADYIFIMYKHESTISNCQSLAILLPCGIVVERFPIRNFAADYPLKKTRGFNLGLIQLIFSVFTTITLKCVSTLRCGLIVFRTFQQLDGLFFIQITLYADYYVNLFMSCFFTNFSHLSHTHASSIIKSVDFGISKSNPFEIFNFT